MRPAIRLACILALAAPALAAPALGGSASAQAPAAAAARPAPPRAVAYAEKHGVPVRVVETGPADRRVTRAFVPITRETFAAFQEHFGAGNGGITLRYNRGNNHLAMALNPGDTYLWARNQIGARPGGGAGYHGDLRSSYGSFEGGGYTMAVRLGSKLDHLRTWLTARETPGDQLFCNGNCMEWLSNAEVAPGTPLFHELGIRRSRDGGNLRAKLLHVANENLDVVGVHVNNLEEFNRLSDSDLLGPPPAGGVDDAAR